MVEISHHSQIDSPWLRNYTTDHFPALISHFPDHWLHYVKAIITFIFCRKCSRSQLNIFRRLKMFSDALAKSGETRWSHLKDYVEKSNQRHWHMSAGWIIFNMLLHKTLVLDIGGCCKRMTTFQFVKILQKMGKIKPAPQPVNNCSSASKVQKLPLETLI